MATIRYVGIEEIGIDAATHHEIESATQKHAARIERMVHNELEIVIHLKAYEKTGERKKFVVAAHANYPGGHVASEKSEWKCVPALQEALEAIERQLEAKFRR